MRYFTVCFFPLKSCMCFLFTAHLNSYYPHFKCYISHLQPVATVLDSSGLDHSRDPVNTG